MRRPPFLVVALLALLSGCGVSFTGDAGSSSSSGSGGTSMGGDAGGPTSSTGGMGGAATTSSSSTGGGAGAGGGEGELVDEGLLARYFMAEGSSGPATGQLLDAGPHGLHLPLTDSGNLTWIETPTGRGLHWAQAQTGGSAGLANIASTMLFDLDGLQQGTVEVVAGPLFSSPSLGARVFHVGPGSNGELALSMNDNHAPVFRLANNDVVTWPAPMNQARHVYHIRLDLSAIDTAKAVELFRDGALVAGNNVNLTLPTQVALPDPSPFHIGNRLNPFDRSPAGDIFYLAIYTVALSDAQIATNATRLGSDDD